MQFLQQTVLPAAALALLAGCGPVTSAPDGGTLPPATLACNAGSNPDGLAYPTGYCGRSPRTGATPGNVMPNYKFQGYPNANVAGGLKTISLSDYYDPCNKRYKLIHISVSALWCTVCSMETDALVKAKPELDQKKVALIQMISEGPTQGMASTQNDLNAWIQGHMSNFTSVLDPEFQNLSGFFEPTNLPWNCDIDPRTMEILDDGTGWDGDVDSELQNGFNALPATPSYAIPAAAGCGQ